MSINVTCPGCEEVFQVPDNLAGKTIRCKSCGETMSVPAAVRPQAAKPLPAKPLRAEPITDDPPSARVVKPRAIVDEDEDEAPARPARRARVEDDDDDEVVTPRRREPKGEAPKKKSTLPLVLGGFAGLLLLAGVAFAGLYFGGVLGDKDEGVVLTPPDQTFPPPGVGFRTDGPAGDPSPPPPAKEPPKADNSSETPPIPGGPRPPVDPKKPILPGVATPVRPVAPTPGPDAAKSKISPERLMSGQMDRETVAKVASATVLIEGEGHNGAKWTGSGWFGLEPNLVFTNAHVLNMKTAGARPPSKLTVHLYRPDRNAGARVSLYRTIPHARIRILGIDRHNDLAVLQIDGEKDLPAPLPVKASFEHLSARQGVTVFGFPLTSVLASIGDLSKDKQPEMSIRPSTVTSLRQDGFGRPLYVQIEGGANQGNSGGPIVDAEGHVIGVVVAGVLNRGKETQLGLAVPTEYVFGLLAGRVAEIEYGQPYRKDGKVHVPVTAECLDPFNRLKAVGIGQWVGDDKKETRPPGTERTGMEASDSGFKEVALTYKHTKDKQVATGELVYPEQQSGGRAYWAQPFYSNALVSKYWLAGNPITMTGPPVDLEPADLVVRYRPGTRRTLTISNSSTLDEFEEGEGAEKNERILLETEVKANELVHRPQQGDQTSVAVLELQYDKVEVKGQIGQRTLEDILPKEFRNLIQQGVKQVQAYGYVSKNGEIYRTASNVRGTAQFALMFKAMSDEVLESLQAASIPMPNGRVDANHTWTAKRTYRLNLSFLDAPQFFPGGPGGKGPAPKQQARTREYKYDQEITFTYQGTRTRGGTKEAVIKIEGTIKPAAGTSAQGGASGRIKGFAYVDLESGAVVEGQLDKEMEIDTSRDGVKRRVSGLNKYKLSRGPAVNQ